ncbi:hypothetical protein [Gymnodinialimonas sp.]
MTSPNQTPQPGAQKNPFMNLGMTHRDVTKAGWPTLDKDNAPNFVLSAAPVVLEKGQTIYRVYGGKAKIVGAYWSPAPPPPQMTEAEWRSECAIEYSWNTGQYVASYTAEADIHLWAGSVEAQPAQSMAMKILPEYWLVGGGPQFFVAHWLINGFTPTPVGETPWPKTAQAAPVAAEALVAQPGDVVPADENATQAFRVSALAEALQASAEALRGAQTYTAVDADALDGAAANLMSSANNILTNLNSDPETVSAEVRSQVGLARHIEVEADVPGQGAVQQRLSEVIAGAAALSGKA